MSEKRVLVTISKTLWENDGDDAWVSVGMDMLSPFEADEDDVIAWMKENPNKAKVVMQLYKENN